VPLDPDALLNRNLSVASDCVHAQETVTAGAAEANGGRSLEHAMSEVDLGFANDALPISSSPGGSMRGGAKCAFRRADVLFLDPHRPVQVS